MIITLFDVHALWHVRIYGNRKTILTTSCPSHTLLSGSVEFIEVVLCNGECGVELERGEVALLRLRVVATQVLHNPCRGGETGYLSFLSSTMGVYNYTIIITMHLEHTCI